MEKEEYERVLSRIGDKALEIAQIKHGVAVAKHASDLAHKHYLAMCQKLAKEEEALAADIKTLTESRSHWPIDNAVIEIRKAEPKH